MNDILTASLAICAVAGGACLARGFCEPYMLRATDCRVAVKGLPNSLVGKRVLHLSDLHASAFGRKNMRLVALTLEQKPDYIFATGDFISRSRGAYQGFLDFLDGISGLCPVYFSLGNHEGWIGKQKPELLKAFLDELKKRGVTVLNDEGVELYGVQGVYIYGLTPERGEDYKTVEMDCKKITEKLGDAPKNASVILLAHEPQFFNSYAEWGANFVLSGHFHGGIIRLPLLGGFVSPDVGLFPAHDGGVYYENNSVMCVSRGLGCSHMNFRFCNVPEAVSVTLEQG